MLLCAFDDKYIYFIHWCSSPFNDECKVPASVVVDGLAQQVNGFCKQSVVAEFKKISLDGAIGTPSGTGCYQDADVSEVFKHTEKKMQGTNYDGENLSVDQQSHEYEVIKKHIQQQGFKLVGRGPNRLKTAIAHFGANKAIWQEQLTSSKIRKGGLRTGSIGENGEPVGVLATFKRMETYWSQSTQETQNNCIRSIPEGVVDVAKNGAVSQTTMLRHNVPDDGVDRDSKGSYTNRRHAIFTHATELRAARQWGVQKSKYEEEMASYDVLVAARKPLVTAKSDYDKLGKKLREDMGNKNGWSNAEAIPKDMSVKDFSVGVQQGIYVKCSRSKCALGAKLAVAKPDASGAVPSRLKDGVLPSDMDSYPEGKYLCTHCRTKPEKAPPMPKKPILGNRGAPGDVEGVEVNEEEIKQSVRKLLTRQLKLRPDFWTVLDCPNSPGSIEALSLPSSSSSTPPSSLSPSTFLSSPSPGSISDNLAEFTSQLRAENLASIAQLAHAHNVEFPCTLATLPPSPPP